MQAKRVQQSPGSTGRSVGWFRSEEEQHPLDTVSTDSQSPEQVWRALDTVSLVQVWEMLQGGLGSHEGLFEHMQLDQSVNKLE